MSPWSGFSSNIPTHPKIINKENAISQTILARSLKRHPTIPYRCKSTLWCTRSRNAKVEIDKGSALGAALVSLLRGAQQSFCFKSLALKSCHRRSRHCPFGADTWTEFVVLDSPNKPINKRIINLVKQFIVTIVELGVSKCGDWFKKMYFRYSCLRVGFLLKSISPFSSKSAFDWLSWMGSYDSGCFEGRTSKSCVVPFWKRCFCSTFFTFAYAFVPTTYISMAPAV